MPFQNLSTDNANENMDEKAQRQARMAGKSQPKQLDHADAYPLMIMMITVAVARLHDLRKQCGSKLSVTQLFSNTCTLPIS